MPPRRSTRAKAAPKQALNTIQPDNDPDEDVVFQYEDDHSSEEEEVKPKPRRKKRAKTTDADASKPVAKQQKRAKNDLRNLPNMPLDILYEIFSVLHPLDLLNLARTTKALRSVLMRRTAAAVWKRSLANVPGPKVPDCPDDLQEAQWAELCFAKTCQFCFEETCERQFYIKLWALRKTICGSCLRDDRLHHFEEGLMYEEALGCSWANLVHSYAGNFCVPEDFVAVGKRILELQGNEDALGEYVLSRMKETWKRRKSVGQYETWSDEHLFWEEKMEVEKAELRAEELLRARNTRCDAIRARLSKLGLDTEMDKIYEWDVLRGQFTEHKLVKQNKPLTDRIWKNIEAPIVEFVAKLKEQRLQLQRINRPMDSRRIVRGLYKEYCQQQNDATNPPLDTVLKFLPFNKVIHDVEHDKEVTKADFAFAMKELPDLCKEWRRTRV